MNSRYSEYLRDTTAMLNAAIRILRSEDDLRYSKTIGAWSEQVKLNMALISGAKDPENRLEVKPACVHPVGNTTCGYTLDKHPRMDHEFTTEVAK